MSAQTHRETNLQTVADGVLRIRKRYHLDQDDGWDWEATKRIIAILLDKDRGPTNRTEYQRLYKQRKRAQAQKEVSANGANTPSRRKVA